VSTVLVIGASRGIGLEFARQYADDGARVIATYRNPDDAGKLRALGAKPIELDVTDATGIAALAWHLDGEPLDLAILNAGVAPRPRTERIVAPTPADFDLVMHTNVLAPMRLIPILAPSLLTTKGKLVVMSSKMGSTALMTSPGSWLYRTSKAALNSVLKAAALELGPQGVVCMAFHPGWVRTDMGGEGADIDARDSVSGMRHVIASANDSHNGKFLNHNGEQLAW
jgi:NAD(P)-dependent dehydrogenase (short-subunit alcohol dehydrogenase family)